MTILADTALDAFPLIAGYTLTEQLYKGSRTAVYRALSSAQKPVVIKVLRQAYPTFHELVHFRNQYAITKNLSIPNIVRSLSLEPCQNGYALVMEDFGGLSLQQYVKSHSLTMVDILAIAIQLAEVLHHLCQHRVVHKDIKPANILIQPASKQVKLMDFSIASLLPKEIQELKTPSELEGSLPYLAPEQTGRMNRSIDYRTDFYSLGVTLYELLTGELPFLSSDPLALVHCHIAKSPVVPHQLKSDLPPVLSQIVLKLMAKNAEDRYQSALGLKHDLQRCLIQWKETGEIAFFELGQRDVSDRFLIPEKLYGRETEVQTLLDAFERVAKAKEVSEAAPSSNAEIVLVAGFSGIGKTAVIKEAYKPITRQKSYFIQGKFDQFNRNTPFSAFISAFRQLMGQLLSETDTALTYWKTRLIEALGENAQVIIDVVPELERLVGSQPAPTELSGSAAQTRFNQLLSKFVGVFTRKEHPLVIFLDDLQWADSASLNLLKVLIIDAQISHLLVLGAYRDNEVFPAHPFMMTLNDLEKHGTTLHSLTLAPLAALEINRMVADTLRCSVEIAKPLANLIYQKTKGNPFFTTQLLQELKEEGCITYNISLGHWQSDLAQVRQVTTTDDVVVFMASRIQKLPERTQTILKLAACLGSQFSLNTLSIVCDSNPSEIAADLWPALKEGFVFPENEAYKFFQAEDLARENNATEADTTEKKSEISTISYRFLHDRVQQAAYCLVPEAQRPEVHYQMGQRWLKAISNENLAIEQHEALFEIVNHINFGQQLSDQTINLNELANLNLIAGTKALSSTAYAAAINYLETGISLIEESTWQHHYSLALNLYRSLCAALLSSASYEALSTVIATALEKISDPVDQADIYVIQVVKFTLQGNFAEAIKAGIGGLEKLGFEIPLNNLADSVQAEFTAIAQHLENCPTATLLNQPTTVEPAIQAAIKLLISLDPPTYITANVDLYRFSSLRAVGLSIEHGNIPESIKAYANYGLLLGLMKDQYHQGYEFADLAVQLSYKLNSQSQRCKASLLLGAWIHVWAKPIAGAADINYQGFLAGMESGEPQFAAYNLFGNIFNRLFQGENLADVAKDIAKYWSIADKIKDEVLSVALAGARIFTHKLCLNQAEENSTLSVNQAQLVIQNGEASQIWFTVCLYYILRMQLACITENFEEGLEYSTAASKILDAAAGFTNCSDYSYYGALILLNLYAELSPEEKTQTLAQVDIYQQSLKIWSDNCPENFLHKYLLVQAERCRCVGEKLDAIDLYDLAIYDARENNYIQDEALANELAAKFFLNWGKDKIAAVYMQAAYYGYFHWGAQAKTDALEQRYPHLIAPILQASDRPINLLESQMTIAASSLYSSTQTSIKASRSTSSINETLDLSATLRASQILSSTIQLDELLRQLTTIILQNSGSDYCALIRPNDKGHWQVESIATLEGTTLCAKLLEHYPDLPRKLIHYVKNTRTTVVIDNGKTELPVIGEYLQQNQPKSALALPILNQGRLIGILYLENKSTCGVYRKDKLVMLKFLCTQVAISLENAQLHKLEQEKTKQLQQSQAQVVQSEKMSALGSLVAGVAHEINNPLGFLNGSLKNAQNYLKDLQSQLEMYQQYYPNAVEAIAENAEDIDLDFVCEDFPKLLSSMQDATDRIKVISNSLRTFSRADTEHKVRAHLHEGIESTILILRYRLRANENRPVIKLIKDYEKLPAIECFPGRLNQVFMNLLANAIDVFDEAAEQSSFAELKDKPQIITIKTSVHPELKHVEIRISDNGKGMPEAVRARIFDYLFTTKGVGKGTGLGLAIAQQIVVEAHGGKIEVHSKIGQGTEFCLQLPL